jgi:non-heme chloroperoxidase
MASLADYVADVTRVVEGLERPPILVGHSMGGMVVQKYLERNTVPGAVLMASVPPGGLALPTLQLMLGDPWLMTQISFMQSWNPAVLDFQAAKRAIFSNDLPDALLLKYAQHFQAESHRAIWDMTVADLPRRWRMSIPPLLVVGAENDVLFPPAMVRATALAYGVEAEIYPNMAHAMMLERRWQRVANRLIEWLETLQE